MEPYWVTTQRLLQSNHDPIVRRPKLTEALLKRPPFRFLHDLITEVTRRTGFAQGLLPGEELKSKEARLDYLSRIINCVGITLDTHVPVRPVKILAGLEPEQTNLFLQMLAQAATCNPKDTQDAVVRCLAGEAMPPPAEEPRSIHHASKEASEGIASSNLSSEKLKRSIYRSDLGKSCEAAEDNGPSAGKQEAPDSSPGVDDPEAENFDGRPRQVPTSVEDSILEARQGNGQSQHSRQVSPKSSDLIHDLTQNTVSEDTDISKGCKEDQPDERREEMQRLRLGIQTLCQGISPLGKAIDYLQEDAEAMAKEYQFWIKEYQTYSAKLEQDQKRTAELLQAEASQTQAIEDAIREQEQVNHKLKAEILRNEEAIFALLMAASTAKSSNMVAN